MVALESINGKKVFEKSYFSNRNGKIVIDGLANLTSGVYILSVQTGSNKWVKKVIKY